MRIYTVAEMAGREVEDGVFEDEALAVSRTLDGALDAAKDLAAFKRGETFEIILGTPEDPMPTTWSSLKAFVYAEVSGFISVETFDENGNPTILTEVLT